MATDGPCVQCDHPKAQHRHQVFDEQNHRWVPPGQTWIAMSAGSCSEPGCRCEHYLAPFEVTL